MVESASGLCATCLSAGDTSRPPPEFRTASFHPVAPAPQTPVGEATATFSAKTGEPETVTREPSGGASHRDSTASVAAPKTESTLPAAPLGYELVRKLGHGGMGDVYLARDVRADRLVALKFLRAAHDPAAVERFLTEVRALARLDHPGIVRVLAHDFDRSVPFFTMPYAPGGTLARRVEEAGPLEPREAATRVAACARAVQVAHEAGVVHRDLKPSNVLLTEVGDPLVSDFGLAKWLDADSGLTTVSGAIGTPGFMPPEQVSRRQFGDVGVAADVYGLGATLYHLLTGRAPLVGDTQEEVLRQIPTVVPDRPRLLRSDVPPGLEAVVMKCLEKRPADRFATAAELADELEKCAAGEEPSTPPLTRWRRVRRWGRQNALQLTAALILAAVAVGLVAAGRATAPIPTSPEPAPVTPLDPVGEKAKRLEAIRADLLAGRPVTLIGEKGEPAWYEAPTGPIKFGESPVRTDADPGGCYFPAYELTILKLLDPPIDRYRVELDIQHVKGPVGEGRAAAPCLGLFLNYAHEPRPDNWTEHQFLSAGFCDLARVEKGIPIPSEVLMETYCHASAPGRLPSPNRLAIPNTERPLGAAALFPGPWRRIVADVSPQQLVVSWHPAPNQTELLVDLSANGLRSHALAHDRVLRQVGRVTGREFALLPAWSPRRGLGVWAAEAEIAVKNVRVIPQ